MTAAVITDDAPGECWSANNEEFNATSLDELLDGNEDLKPGVTVWRADAVKPKLSHVFDAEDAIQQMNERAFDIGGEAAEDYPDVTKEQIAELDALIKGWIAKNAPPTFWLVQNAKPYLLSTDDFPENLEPVEASFAEQAAAAGAA